MGFVAADEAVEGGRVDVDVERVVVAEGEAAELEQEPKAELQPEPQYALDDPQYPYLEMCCDQRVVHVVLCLPRLTYCEQQLPNTDLKHVKPLFPPQLPSFDTFADAEIGTGKGLQFPKPDWQPESQ